MPISLQDLKAVLDPRRTALILGAGASVPSGAPTSAQLASYLWREVAKSSPQSDDLVETASVLERRYSRHAVVAVIQKSLENLRPTGGLLAIPRFLWTKVFTTNFDTLIEQAYRACNLEVAPIRSNYDFSNREATTGTRVYKIHGCISQDRAFGHNASMTLTESDYESFHRYRQSLFTELQSSLYTGDVLIIGQSLRDRHLQDLVKRALDERKQDGVPGRVYVLVYDADDLRAPLLEDRGAKIAFGSLDEFAHVMAAGVSEPAATITLPSSDLLPVDVVSSVIDVLAHAQQNPNVLRMFNGGAATYADIAAGVTFERTAYAELADNLEKGDPPFITIVGAAGVGKTTFARQLISRLPAKGIRAWEHRSEFPLHHQPWATLEARLRNGNELGILLLDECTKNLRGTNALVDYLSGIESPALRLVLTANSAQWAPRIKNRNIFARGKIVELSRLEEPEIRSLVALAEFNAEVASLVDKRFRNLPRDQKLSALREKCSADMFVCLKNIFANENLDIILLQEYDELDDHVKDYYRYVSALEAVGARVHRQLLIRMLGISADQVAATLLGLSGIVDEYDIDSRKGLYGWETRHLVIARRIADYKFSALDELTNLFTSIIDNLNPTVSIELQSAREICDSEFGIGRIGDASARRALYRRLIEAVPGERIPRHRLIRELLDQGALEEAEQAIRNAENVIGTDAPMERYRVRLLMVRSRETKGISDTDRLALLRKAYESAMKNTERYSWDKQTYLLLCEVAFQLVQRGETPYILDEALRHARQASDRILDPEMRRRLRDFERARTRM